MGLNGRTIIVTGAASGIGHATARRAADQGARVIAVDLVPPAGFDDHHDVVPAVADVRDGAAIADLVASVDGRIDGLVTAAGVAGGGAVHQLDEAEWERVIGINLTGTFLCCKYVIDRMLGQEPRDGERGSVVTVASIEGLEGTAGGGPYNASKGAVVMLTKCMAIDYGRQGIRANALCPGYIDTPMMQSVTAMPGMERFAELMREEHVLRRHGRAEEMAAVATFLLSPDASFVTGHAMVADGGFTAGRDFAVTPMLGL